MTDGEGDDNKFFLCFPTGPFRGLSTSIDEEKLNEAKTFFYEKIHNFGAGKKANAKDAPPSDDTNQDVDDDGEETAAEKLYTKICKIGDKAQEIWKEFQNFDMADHDIFCSPQSSTSSTPEQCNSPLDGSLDEKVQSKGAIFQLSFDEDVENDKQLAVPDEFDSEQWRLRTFENSSIQDRSIQQALAAAGFYSIGGCTAKCFICGYMLLYWDSMNDPRDGAWHRLGCSFVQTQQQGREIPNSNQPRHVPRSRSLAELGACGGENSPSREGRVFSRGARVQRSATVGDMGPRLDGNDAFTVALPGGIERVKSTHSFELTRVCANCDDELLDHQLEICTKCRERICDKPECQMHEQRCNGLVRPRERRANG